MYFIPPTYTIPYPTATATGSEQREVGDPAVLPCVLPVCRRVTSGQFGDVRGAVSGAEAVFGPILAPHARTVANDFLREQERYLGLYWRHMRAPLRMIS